jgi:hypothetical protein
VILYHFFKPVFQNTWDFSKAKQLLDKINTKKTIKTYGNLIVFLLLILNKKKKDGRTKELSFIDKMILDNMKIKIHEYQAIIRVFYCFYVFFRHLFNSNHIPNNRIDSLSISKSNLNKLSDFWYLFKNRPIELNTFKKQFSNLNSLYLKNPCLFIKQGSYIKISEVGVELTKKIYKFNRIGRNFPSELKIKHNNSTAKFNLEN